MNNIELKIFVQTRFKSRLFKIPEEKTLLFTKIRENSHYTVGYFEWKMSKKKISWQFQSPYRSLNQVSTGVLESELANFWSKMNHCELWSWDTCIMYLMAKMSPWRIFFTSFDIQFRLLWALETKGNFGVESTYFLPHLIYLKEKKSWVGSI